MSVFSAPIFLDANLFLLLAIGTMDRTLISRFKRTEQFTPEEYDALASMVGRAEGLVTTPHILTEVNSLANALRDDLRDDFTETFRMLIAACDEHFTDARTLSQHRLFRFGIADVSAATGSRGTLFLTADGRLATWLASEGRLVLDLSTAIALLGQNA